MKTLVKWSVIATLIGVTAWVTAGIITSISMHVLYNPPQPQKQVNPVRALHAKPRQTRENYDIITTRNLFNVARNGKPTVAQDPSNAPFSKLKLILKGTVAGPEDLSRAIIEENNQQSIYRIGDLVNGAVIQAIFRNEVVLSVAGRPEKLAMNYDIPGREDPNLAKLVASYPEPMKEILKQTTGAKVNPEVPPASFPGLVLSSSPIASSLAKSQALTGIIERVRKSCAGEDAGISQFGVQAGDIIRSINGVPVQHNGRQMRPAGRLQFEETSVRFELERNHSIISVNIPISSYTFWKGS